MSQHYTNWKTGKWVEGSPPISALAYWSAGVLLLGVVLLGWLLMQALSGWIGRLRG